jgi:hypothetical protein
MGPISAMAAAPERRRMVGAATAGGVAVVRRRARVGLEREAGEAVGVVVVVGPGQFAGPPEPTAAQCYSRDPPLVQAWNELRSSTLKGHSSHASAGLRPEGEAPGD